MQTLLESAAVVGGSGANASELDGIAQMVDGSPQQVKALAIL
jgi:hypothetical protein